MSLEDSLRQFFARAFPQGNSAPNELDIGRCGELGCTFVIATLHVPDDWTPPALASTPVATIQPQIPALDVLELSQAIHAAMAESGMHSQRLAARLVALFHGRMVANGPY
jgi:hypothetical protein